MKELETCSWCVIVKVLPVIDGHCESNTKMIVASMRFKFTIHGK